MRSQKRSHEKAHEKGGELFRSRSKKNEFFDKDVVSGTDTSTDAPSQLSGDNTICAVDENDKSTTWQLEGDGAGRVILVKMAPDSTFSMQRGAMVCMSSAVSLSLDFGLKKTYRRFFGGESLIHTIARVPSDKSGEVRLAGTGDITLFNLQPEHKLLIIPSHYVASTPDVKLQLAGLERVGFWKRMISNTGLFFLIAKGKGAIALEACGQLQSRAITPDDGTFIVDNEHVVAWTASLKMEPQLAAQNTQDDGPKRSKIRRAMSSLMSGEGVVLAFSGTGTVFFQTRLDRIPPLEARMARLEMGQMVG